MCRCMYMYVYSRVLMLQEERLLQVAYHYEQAARVMAQRPEAALVP